MYSVEFWFLTIPCMQFLGLLWCEAEQLTFLLEGEAQCKRAVITHRADCLNEGGGVTESAISKAPETGTRPVINALFLVLFRQSDGTPYNLQTSFAAFKPKYS